MKFVNIHTVANARLLLVSFSMLSTNSVAQWVRAFLRYFICKSWVRIQLIQMYQRMTHTNVGGKQIDTYYTLSLLGPHDGALYTKGKMLKKLSI